MHACLIESATIVVRVTTAGAVAAAASGVDADAAVGVAEVAVAVREARVGDHLLPAAEAVEVGPGAVRVRGPVVLLAILKKMKERSVDRMILLRDC